MDEYMDEKTYRRTVIKMRAHGDAWYRLHKQSDLIEAKRLEKLVDADNKRWLDAQAEVRPTDVKQANLFEENGNEATKDQ